MTEATLEPRLSGLTVHKLRYVDDLSLKLLQRETWGDF